MPFISVTRLRLKAIRHLPGFAWFAVRSHNQARRAAGFRGGAVLADRRLTFWTLTAWDSPEHMRAYMTTGPHRRVMPRLAAWCDEASIVHWDQAETALPTWVEADRRMRAEGRPSKVHRPSEDHSALSFSPPRRTTAAPITPARHPQA